MSELNDVKLFGRVVKDAELKKTANNLSVVIFSIANNHSIKTADGKWESKPDFFPLAIYGTFAENMVSKLVKGQKVIVNAYLKQNKWEKDGIKHSETGIGVRNIQLIFDSKKDSEATTEESSVTYPAAEDESNPMFTEEQLAEMYTSESERISGNSEEDIF